jgi:uncharacterized protein with HEPN domain
MSKHETLATLRQLKEFAEEAVALAKGRSREDLTANLGLRRHAERVIELIGEACNRLPEEILANHPENSVAPNSGHAKLVSSRL